MAADFSDLIFAQVEPDSLLSSSAGAGMPGISTAAVTNKPPKMSAANLSDLTLAQVEPGWFVLSSADAKMPGISAAAVTAKLPETSAASVATVLKEHSLDSEAGQQVCRMVVYRVWCWWLRYIVHEGKLSERYEVQKIIQVIKFICPDAKTNELEKEVEAADADLQRRGEVPLKKLVRQWTHWKDIGAGKQDADFQATKNWSKPFRPVGMKALKTGCTNQAFGIPLPSHCPKPGMEMSAWMEGDLPTQVFDAAPALKLYVSEACLNPPVSPVRPASSASAAKEPRRRRARPRKRKRDTADDDNDDDVPVAPALRAAPFAPAAPVDLDAAKLALADAPILHPMLLPMHEDSLLDEGWNYVGPVDFNLNFE